VPDKRLLPVQCSAIAPSESRIAPRSRPLPPPGGRPPKRHRPRIDAPPRDGERSPSPDLSAARSAASGARTRRNLLFRHRGCPLGSRFRRTRSPATRSSLGLPIPTNRFLGHHPGGCGEQGQGQGNSDAVASSASRAVGACRYPDRTEAGSTPLALIHLSTSVSPGSECLHRPWGPSSRWSSYQSRSSLALAERAM